MKLPDPLRPYAALWREDLGAAWRAFLRWRRDGWPVRVVIVLLLGGYFFAHQYIGPGIPGLIRMAVQGIFVGSEPRVVTSGARAYKAREADRLRRALRAHLDADRDGEIGPGELERCRALGVEPGDLEGPVLDADLDALVDASRRAGLVPGLLTARRIRRDALRVGHAEAEEMFGPARVEIERMIAGAEPSPRNWSPGNWWQTAGAILGLGLRILGVADPVTALAWLLLSYLTARLVVLLAGRRARWVAACTPPCVMLTCILLALLLYEPRRFGFAVTAVAWAEFFARAAGGVVFSFCAAYRGSRSVRDDAPPDSTSRTAAHIGGVILTWGLLSALLWAAFFGLGAWRSWYRSGWDVFLRSGYFMTWLVPAAVKIAGILAGAALVVWADVRTIGMSRADGGPAVA